MKIATKLTKRVAEFVNGNFGYIFHEEVNDIFHYPVHNDYSVWSIVQPDYTEVSEQEFIDMVSMDMATKQLCQKKYIQMHGRGIRQVSFSPQPHYNNDKGSLYKVATERNWNAYLFDVVKRLERGGKKDPLKQEIEKSIDVLKIWLNELPKENETPN